MTDAPDDTNPRIKLIEKSLEAHERYGRKHHAPEGPFRKISDRFDAVVKESLSEFGRHKLSGQFSLEGPHIDYCFEQIHKGVVREVVWRIKGEEHYPVEVALHFRRGFFGLKADGFAVRGLRGGLSRSKPDLRDLRETLNQAEPFPFIRTADQKDPARKTP
ncbi:MAG TPA: hypothetical protein ENN17_05565 [bacterium]|nr:hypothetical protein [bacterium]